MIKINDRFRHFKTSDIYRIISLFVWEPTKEPAVLYENEKTLMRWGRTVSVFLEEVAAPANPDVKVKRFERVDDTPDHEFQQYYLKECLDEATLQPYLEVMTSDGGSALTLKGGMTLVIGITFQNMGSKKLQRGDDYMAGVVAGCTHMHLNNIAITP